MVISGLELARYSDEVGRAIRQRRRPVWLRRNGAHQTVAGDGGESIQFQRATREVSATLEFFSVSKSETFVGKVAETYQEKGNVPTRNGIGVSGIGTGALRVAFEHQGPLLRLLMRLLAFHAFFSAGAIVYRALWATLHFTLPNGKLLLPYRKGVTDVYPTPFMMLLGGLELLKYAEKLRRVIRRSRGNARYWQNDAHARVVAKRILLERAAVVAEPDSGEENAAAQDRLDARGCGATPHGALTSAQLCVDVPSRSSQLTESTRTEAHGKLLMHSLTLDTVANCESSMGARGPCSMDPRAASGSSLRSLGNGRAHQSFRT
ncbi:hypothetical protein SeLEV6574_g01876 [Synchytrium endobioticum]|uniref:Uncharacterized protein n=1 Tax=Synchytrium endobioticum TaxID=286115 RepID=A0A507DCT7_9FUNG|nr:hypothetical protein SeLEV6574_g01876 [Synchytrium endobioticum]